MFVLMYAHISSTTQDRRFFLTFTEWNMTNKKTYGVIFDMDGVISDTQKYHGEAEVAILAEYEITTLSSDDMTPITGWWIGDNFAGMQLKEWMGKIFATHNKLDIFDIHAIEQKKIHRLAALYATATIKSIPGAIDFIRGLAESERCHLAVVTASMPDAMHTVLNALDVSHYFEKIVSIYDIDPVTWVQFRSKGEPDVYVRIMDERGLPHRAFVMIEDGDTGMRGAIAAGGTAIAILGKNSPDRFPLARARHTDGTTLSQDEIEWLLVNNGSR
jgi:beta-phosphoglucomutase